MNALKKDEIQEVTLRLTQGELLDLKQSIGMLRMLDAFYPEGDAVQMLAVRVLEAAGVLKVIREPAKAKPRPKKKAKTSASQKRKAGV